MKKFLSFLTLLALLFMLAVTMSLAGCAGPDQTAPQPTAAPEDRPEPDPAEAGPIAVEHSYRAYDLQPPSAMGRPKALALSGDTLYAAGQTTLYAMDTDSRAWRALDYVPEDSEMSICALATGGDTLALLSSGFWSDEVTMTYGMNYSLTVYDLQTEQVAASFPLEGLGNASFLSFFLMGDQAVIQFHNGLYVGSVLDGQLTFVEPEKPLTFLSEVEGRLLAGASAEDEDSSRLYELDPATGAMTELCALENNSGVSYVSGSGAFFITETSASRLDPEAGNTEALLDWADAGLDLIGGLNTLTCGGDGSFFIVDSFAGAVYQVRPYDGPARKELIVGSISGRGIYVDQAIALFNTLHDEYVAKLVTYDGSEADKILTEIHSGKGPDVLFLGSSTDRENAFNRVSVGSGMLVDLLPYLDADEDISREDFLPGLLDSMLEKGGLYRLIPSFQPFTVTAPRALTAELNGWTVDTLFDLNANLPEGYLLCGEPNRASMMDVFCEFASIEYVDYENASCAFDDPSFARWLELIGSLTYRDDLGDTEVDGSMLSLGYTSARQSANFRDRYGDYEYVGFPGKDGPVNFFHSPTGGFSILSSSENKDAAWEFLKVLLLPRVQEGTIAGFGNPVIEASFDALAEQNLQNEDLDFTQADADRLKAAAAQGIGFSRGSTVTDIIREEAEKYFSGQNSLDNTVKLIQSRAGIYLAEQS